MKGISVIICCYNSGNKLAPTLLHLAKQIKIENVEYELILVDNNCTDDTISIASREWKSNNIPFPLKIVTQPIPGLNFARELGIENALYNYVLFCDDDNWLSEDYLKKVHEIFESNLNIGLVGGVGYPVSDTNIPDWFNNVQGFGYAVGNEGRSTGFVESVYGAGMGIRKSAYFELKKNYPNFELTDRKGNQLSSGGDTEICLLIKKSGFLIYFDENLTFNHFLSQERLKWNYYLKLRVSFGKAEAVLKKRTGMNNGSFKISQKGLEFFRSCKYVLKHLNLFLFPNYFKTKECADFHQNLSFRISTLIEK